MKIAALFVALLGLGTVAMAADPELFRDDFSRASGWTPSSEPTTTYRLADGVMRVTNTTKNFGSQSTRPLQLPPAAAYTLEFTMRQVDAPGENTNYGIALRAPDNDEVGFLLHEGGHARIYYWHDGAWAPDALDWVKVPSMKTGAGAVNKVRVVREAGRFHFYINDVLAGSSDIVDLMPSQVVLVTAEEVTVDFDDIVVRHTGQDSRIARMLLLAPVPGQTVVLKDDFTRSAKDMMRGKTLKKDLNDTWLIDSDSDRYAGFDYGRGVYRYERKVESDRMVYAGNVTDPRPWAGWSIGAKVAYTRVSKDGCGGPVVIGKPLKEDDPEPRILACYRPDAGSAQIWYYPPGNTEWRVLMSAATTAIKPGMNDVRLVLINDKLLLFLNGEYQGDADKPGDFRYEGIGLHVDGFVGIEVDDYDAREI